MPSHKVLCDSDVYVGKVCKNQWGDQFLAREMLVLEFYTLANMNKHFQPHLETHTRQEHLIYKKPRYKGVSGQTGVSANTVTQE